MSTVFYGYSIKKSDWQEFHTLLREHYLTYSMTMKMAKSLTDDKVKLWDFAFNKDNWVEIQLFDFDDCWIFRIMEIGYYFQNTSISCKESTKMIFYDNRVDDEPNENLEIVNEIDKLIKAKRYFIAYIIDESDLLQ